MPTLNEMLNKYNNQNNPGGTEKEDKSILKTASAGLQYLGQGALRGLEAVFVDTPLQIAAGTRKLFGDDEGAKGLMEASNVSLTNALINTAAGKENNPFLNNNQNLWNEEVDKNSYIKEDNLAGKIISATGEMLPTIAIGGSISGGQGAKQLGGNILLGSKAFSGATNEAYQDSGDIGKSMLYGLGSAGTELLTEKISGGIPGLKQINGTTKKEIAKNYLKSMIGEGAEEVIASLANPLLQTTYKGTDALKQYGTSDYWKGVAESGIVGAAVGGLLDSPNTISSLRNSQNSSKTTTNLNRNTQNNINTLINDNDAENSAKYSYLPTNNEKSNNLRQSASNYFNNSQETINMINTIDKVVQDKGYNVLFDNTIVNSKGESVNAQIKALDNGEIEIKINPNSERAGEFLLCHEITHAIETNSMKQLVMDYASKHSDFNESLESLKQSYGTNEVTDEVLADISGQLFGNQEFINNLSMQQPNVFKRIYNKIVELANKITGNSKESLFIKDLKNKWETAYRNTSLEESINNLNDSTKYMMTSVKGMQNGLNVNNRYQDIKNKYDRAIQLESSGQYDNEAIRQETGWFKDKEGNWEFEISDHNTKFKIQPKADAKYKLSDIFEANTLYEMYPELKNISIEFKNIKGKNANYNSLKNMITIKNSMLNDLDNLRGTLLHEIQHYIQEVEGLPTGTTILFGNEQYANSKGEIEAAITKNRRNLTAEQRKAIIPESAKENPVHPNRDAILNHKRNAVEKIAEQIYNIFGGNSNEISEEIDFQNIEQTNEITDKSYQEDTNGIEELENSSFSLKQKQLEIVLENNPAEDNYHTWIRNVDDIKTFEETLEDVDYKEYYEAGEDFDETYSADMAKEALETGKITVYSSYPIEQGIFVSPSRMEAESYSGDGKVYSKEVDLTDIAWIDPTQGQYAKVNDIEQSVSETSTTDNQGRTLTKEQQEYFKDSKVRDEKGKLEVMYRGDTGETINVFDKNKSKKSNLYGTGFYFSDESMASLYGNTTPYYLNIVNPLYVNEDTHNITKEQYSNFIKLAVENEDYSFENYGNMSTDELINKLYDGRSDFKLINDVVATAMGDYRDALDVFEKANGIKYDGIISNSQTVVFGSNQIKNIDNTNPTSDEDIRYSQQNDKWQEYVEKNYKSIGTRTDMKKHLYPLETAQTKNKTVEKLPTAKRDIPQDPTKESTYNTTEEIQELTTKQQRHKKVQEYRQQAKEDIGNMSDWVDTSLMKQKTNTMKRNLRDIMPKEQADSLYKKYFQNISKNNATIENEINKYNSKIQKLNLNDKESTAVQLLGEYKYNPDTNITGLQVTDYISNNKLDYNKISKSVEVFRETYDELFTKVNETLKEQGYDEIPYRKGYFPHFIETHGKTILGKFAEKLGWKFNDQELPTDIAGLTENFLPGKKWTSFAQHRKGKITDYNALKGFDNYVRGAMDIIYHTEDIQRLRALENEIRYQHSEKGVQQEIDKISQNDMLTSEQQEKLIEEVYDNYKIPLPNFVTNLRDFTNNLAGKKSALDRSMEQGIGRNMYNTMSNISNRVSANMVGLNISSALTNFIPITQAWSQVKTKNLVKAVKQTMSSTFADDHFADSSTFLTNRTKKADRLYKTGLEKASDKAGALFEAIDSFTSNVIVRSKYLENIENGMSKTQAIENADEFAKDVIAGRSKGELPTIFNSKNPVVKLVTAFQLEVNNQYGYMFKDLPKDLKDEGMAKLVGAFLKMFLGAWLYNKAKESITGTKSAFSPIDMIEETIETVGNEDLSTYEKISTTAKNYAQDLPFVGGLLGGGRLPINSAIPDVAVVTESITNLSSEDADKKQSALKNLTNELKKPLFYVVMPFGGGQLKKTIEGASMYSGKLPTAGSYTASGNLRFTADKTPTGVAKALTFGQYSSKEAQDYIDSGFKTISKNHIQEMKDLEMTSTEYRKYRNGLANAGTKNSEKLDYINSLDVSIEQKNIMANNVVDSDKYTVDMSNYNDYGSYETMKYALQNPTNYSIITSITNYDDYLSYKEEVNNIKEKYSGTENSTVRKQKVFQYVNSLPYSKTQKIILFNMLGNYGISNYKNDVHSYINGLDISKSEKEQMWQQIYGK